MHQKQIMSCYKFLIAASQTMEAPMNNNIISECISFINAFHKVLESCCQTFTQLSYIGHHILHRPCGFYLYTESACYVSAIRLAICPSTFACSFAQCNSSSVLVYPYTSLPVTNKYKTR